MATSDPQEPVDCVVIGAGFSGLAAADALIASGVSVHILEARDRVGGRARTETLDSGLWLDYGGQWLGPGHDRMYAYARRFDQSIWASHTRGKHGTYLGGRLRHGRFELPTTMSKRGLFALARATLAFELLVRRVDLERPWETKSAGAHDRITLADWMAQKIRHPEAHAVFQLAVEAVLAKHPADVSFLQALVYFRSSKSFLFATGSRGGAQQDRLQRGLQPLAQCLVDDLKARGASLSLGAAVTQIVERDGTLAVFSQLGKVEARAVICATPPVLAAEIAFEPPLPSEKRRLLEGLTPGCAMKCFAVYDRPFWREQGRSGQVISDEGPVHAVFDVTPPDQPHGVLMGFIEGRDAQKVWRLDADERRKVVLGQLTAFFGEAASAPVDYRDHSWEDDEWTRGCYAGVAGPEILSTVGHTIRAPHGGVFWAGTETATHYMGYFEGAVRAGERAAGEVVTHLAA